MNIVTICNGRPVASLKAVLMASAMLGASALHAQTGAPPAATPSVDAANQDDGEIIVTGSRIQNGNNRPTPVTVVSADLLQATTPSSIPDALNRLPAFNSTSTPNNAVNANGRGFGTPGNFLNLRALSPIRTLILQDGNRVPGTFFDTTVDTNMLPQMLISRVEVVTGGASSVYGSDAVTGVVNFITDTKFTGVKGLAQGGISTYGDAPSMRGGIAIGLDVGKRGHFIGSIEYYRRDGIQDTAARPLGRLYPAVVGSGSAAVPFSLIYDVHQSNASVGGLVRTGPFAGQQFLPDGSLGAFNAGTPTATGNTSIGGDGGRVENEWLLYDFKSGQAFGRFDYELTETTKAYISARYGETRSFGASQIYTNISNATPASPTNSGGSYPLWIYSGNAFLTASQQAALTSAGVSSFALNRFDSDLMRELALQTRVKAFSTTVGAEGELFADWTWDAHYTRGENRTTLTSINNVNSANFFAAADAVRDPATGNIVCRVSITAPGAFPGCVPINLFGNDRSSRAARDYVFEDTSWTARNTLDDFAGNVTGTLFEGWAGPVKAAAGAEYRHASLLVETSVPVNVFNPQNLRLGPAGNSLPTSYPAANLAYFKEVQAGAVGAADIYEGNIEVDFPLLRDLPFAQALGFNGAYRHAYYKTTGNRIFGSTFSANTWKLGLDWSVVDGLRFRAARSRDFRAPTLWDLYQQQVISASGVTDPLTNTAAQLNTVSGGNPNLEPEVSMSWTVGTVISPSFLPGFALSIDYFDLKIDNAIGAVNGLNPVLQNICLSSGGTSPFCDLVTRPISYNSTSPANFPTQVLSLNQNIAQVRAKGFDVEASYATQLAGGALSARLLWTHQPTLTTLTLPGAQITNASKTEALPRDKVNFTLNYAIGMFTINLLEQYAGPIRWSANPTLIFNIPNVRSTFQTDINLSYDFDVGKGRISPFLSVRNLFNDQGGVYTTSGFTGSPGLRYPNVAYADAIGRYFTAGARFRF